MGYTTILPGVEIGEHAIVGAASVVTHDVPDYAVAAGNPAKVIKIIFTHSENSQTSYTNPTAPSPTEYKLWLSITSRHNFQLARKAAPCYS